jgi:hypothetical protein
LNAEYLLWWVRDDKVQQPIISTIPGGVPITPGAVLPPGTLVPVFPAHNTINYNPLNGVRLSGGVWLNGEGSFGIDATGFWLQDTSRVGVISSPGVPILVENYFSANAGNQPAFIQLSSPDPRTGSSATFAATSTIKSIAGGDADFRFRGYAIFADTTDYLLGGRYFGFNESLNMTTQANFHPGNPVRSLTINDQFTTHTQFYGVQIGFNSRICNCNGFALDGILKLALGDSHQTADVAGSNTIVLANGVQNTQPGGFFTQQSNIGSHTKDKAAVLPELGLNLAYNFTNYASVWVGYNMLYLNQVARPGAVINPVINDANVRYISNPTPGNANQPAFIFHSDSFWMQGITVGMRLQF